MPNKYRYLFAALVLGACATNPSTDEGTTTALEPLSTTVDVTSTSHPPDTLEPGPAAITTTPTVVVVADPLPEEPPETTEVPVATTRPRPDVHSATLEPCGGDLPPCEVKRRESGGRYDAYNPRGCVTDRGRGCYGAWQFSHEWACKLGLPCDLTEATPEQQDDAARILWDGGRGCGNWSGPNWNGCSYK